MIAALKTAGFEVVEVADLAEPQPHLNASVQARARARAHLL